MKIYVIELCVPYEPGEVLEEAYTDELKALDVAEKLNKDMTYAGYEVRELEVNEETL